MLVRIVWLMIVPLFMGALVYVFLRTGSPLADFFSSSWKLKHLSPLIAFIHPWLPDFCWCFSLGNFLYSFRRFQSSVFMNAVVLFVLLSSELIQLFNSINFVFDYWDLLAAFCAWAVSYRLKYFNQ